MGKSEKAKERENIDAKRFPFSESYPISIIKGFLFSTLNFHYSKCKFIDFLSLSASISCQKENLLGIFFDLDKPIFRWSSAETIVVVTKGNRGIGFEISR